MRGHLPGHDVEGDILALHSLALAKLQGWEGRGAPPKADSEWEHKCMAHYRETSLQHHNL